MHANRHRILWVVLVVLALACSRPLRTAADAPAPTRVAGAARPTTSTAATARNRAHVGTKPPLYLEVRATVRGSTRGPFVPDLTLHSGDHIELLARTSSAARVYLLHCDAEAELSVFPDSDGIAFRADQWVPLPAAGLPIELGTKLGPETFYVVATRDALEVSDATLRTWFSVNPAGVTRCGAALEAALAGASKTPSEADRRFATAAVRSKVPYALRGIDVTKSTRPIARAFAELDGIVVLRFAYRHAR